MSPTHPGHPLVRFTGVQKTYDGLSLRVWQDSDIRNDELLTRIDILYGYAAIRPEWACAGVHGERANLSGGGALAAV